MSELGDKLRAIQASAPKRELTLGQGWRIAIRSAAEGIEELASPDEPLTKEDCSEIRCLALNLLGALEAYDHQRKDGE